MAERNLAICKAFNIAGFPAVALLVAMSSAHPVLAQGQSTTFTPPAGCTAYLTTQNRGCTVAHHWICEADPQGNHWRLMADGDGPFYLSYSDSEFRWLQSWDLRAGTQSRLLEPEEDPASMSELFETGTDSMVFSLVREQDDMIEQRDYTGFDALTGESVIVDGHELEVTSFSYEYDTGLGPRQTSGTQYVSRDWRLFFGGIETVVLPSGESFEYDNSPAEFAEPGEAGFLTMQPIYDCGEIMS